MLGMHTCTVGMHGKTTTGSPASVPLLHPPPSSSSSACTWRMARRRRVLCCKANGKKGQVIKQARSVRPVPIRIISVGKNRKNGVDTITLSYLEKLRRYCVVEDVQIRSNPTDTSDVNAQVEAEGNRVLRSISTKDWVVLLDERGRQLTSDQLASLIEDAGGRIPSALVFCIGGPYGHGSHVFSRANETIRLSSMVLNHQVALIVLLEQLYRAWTILCGEKYHH